MGLIKKGAASTKPLAWKVELRAKIEELRRLEQAAFGPRHGKTDFRYTVAAFWLVKTPELDHAGQKTQLSPQAMI
jgi:hypothetical protein